MEHEILEIYKIFLKSSGICTDSRKVKKDCLFFCLQGEFFDGNTFAAKAIEKGALCAIIDNEKFASKKTITVQDTLKTLQLMAKEHIKQLNLNHIIAITGSNGKTTTKELVKIILKKKFKTFATIGNMNNHIGLPISILNMSGEDDYKIPVFELGVNHQNEFEILLETCQPTLGIITNIGKDHMGEFGGMEGIVSSYTEFIKYFEENKIPYFFNEKDKIIRSIISNYNYNNRERFAFGNTKVEIEKVFPFLEIGLNDSFKIKTKFYGGFNVENILAALSLGYYYGVSSSEMIEAIESYKPDNNRSQIIKKDSNMFILDAYNANPSSMTLSIKDFIALKTKKHRIIILGDMFELGEYAEDEHRKIVEMLKDFSCKERVILVGEEFGKQKNIINCTYFENYTFLQLWLMKQDFKESIFFIKGSRGMSLEKILK